MLNKKTFRCERCGQCCRKYVIKLYNYDIKKKKKNYEED